MALSSRPVDPSVALWSAAAAASVIALQVAGKSARDALFCAIYSPEELAKAMVLGAVLSGLLSLAAARAFHAFGPFRVLLVLLALNAAGFGAEFWGLPLAPRETALALYLHTAGLGGVIISGFWSVVNERLDPHALRASVARIGTGASLGGLCGGVLAERLAAWASARATLLALAILSVAAALGVWLQRPARAPALRDGADETPDPRALTGSYLRTVALFVGLTALSSSVVDFAFKARAMEHFSNAEELVRFFALFYTGMNLAALFVQIVVTPRILERAGLGAALTGLPATLIVSGVAGLLLPGLVTQSILRAADGSLGASLYRSAYEPLYTPLPAAKKRAAKALIDVTVDKLGDGLGSALVWGLAVALPAAALQSATGVAVAVALLTVALAARLHQGYVDELASSLRRGQVAIEERDVTDRTTRLTLSRTAMQIDRGRLLAEIQALRGETARGAAPDGTSKAGEARPAGVDLSGVVRELGSNDRERIKKALSELPAEPALVAFLVPLLGRNDVGGEAMARLGTFGDKIVGQLGDALLDRSRSVPAVRRRLARVLANAGGARAAAVLVAALDDPDAGVRRQLAAGLDRLAAAGVAVPVGTEAVFALVRRELDEGDTTTHERRLRHLFALLGLAYDREAMELARRALGTNDPKLRGTALEYLENVLPDAVKARLFRLLETAPPPATHRPDRELLDELKRSFG